jgi:hypothetical protein
MITNKQINKLVSAKVFVLKQKSRKDNFKYEFEHYNHQNYYEFNQECGRNCYLIKQNKVVYMKTEKQIKNLCKYINKTQIPIIRIIRNLIKNVDVIVI